MHNSVTAPQSAVLTEFGGDSSPPALPAGMAYLSLCLSVRAAIGVVIGVNGEARRSLLDAFAAETESRSDCRLARIDMPMDSPQVFLGAVLAELGLDVYEASPDELNRLLLVFLRHESIKSRRVILLIDNVESFGPRALDFLQSLALVAQGDEPAVTCILAGSPALHRVLDSPGMAALGTRTRERFDLDRSCPVFSPEPLHGQEHHGVLVVTLEGKLIERRILTGPRLLIGRSAHNDLRIDSTFVSRHHAVLVTTPRAAFIVDLRSTNGTLVNGQPISESPLIHGDLISIGNLLLRYENPAATRRPPPRPANDPSASATAVMPVTGPQ